MMRGVSLDEKSLEFEAMQMILQGNPLNAQAAKKILGKSGFCEGAFTYSH